MRHKNDFYATPDWCVKRLFEHLSLPGGMWLEPCVGRGDIVRAVSEIKTDITWDVNDLELPKQANLGKGTLVDRVTEGGFFSFEPPEGRFYDVCFTNPPYSMAQEFVEKALTVSNRVVMLLRLGFLATRKRSQFLRKQTPSVYVLPNRPSFNGEGNDMSEYAWFVWDKDSTESKVVILDETPKKIRKDWERDIRSKAGEYYSNSPSI